MILSCVSRPPVDFTSTAGEGCVRRQLLSAESKQSGIANGNLLRQVGNDFGCNSTEGDAISTKAKREVATRVFSTRTDVRQPI